MNFKVEDAKNSSKIVTITVDYDKYEENYQSELIEASKNMKIEGFRKGKVPLSYIEKKHKETISAAAIEKTINSTVFQTIDEAGIIPISKPEIIDVDVKEGKHIEYKAQFDVYPKIEVTKYTNFSFEKDDVEFTNKDVETVIKEYAETKGSLRDASAAKKIAKGDTAVIDFDGYIDDEPFDGGKSENFELVIGSGTFIGDFETQLIGLKKGETKEINVTFPDNYHAENLKGKPAMFKIEVKGIKVKDKIELNDKLAKELDEEIESMDMLKEKLSTKLKKTLETETLDKLHVDIINKLIDENNFEVPDSLVSEQAKNMANSTLSNYYGQGIDPTLYGIDVDKIAEDYRDMATNQVKGAIIMNTLGVAEGVNVSDEDLEQEYNKIAEEYGKDVKEIKEIYQADKLGDSLKNKIFTDKFFTMIKDKNKITNKPLSYEKYAETARQ